MNSIPRKRQPTLVFLPEKSQGQRSLASYSPCSHKELNKTGMLSTGQKINEMLCCIVNLSVFFLSSIASAKLGLQRCKNKVRTQWTLGILLLMLVVAVQNIPWVSVKRSFSNICGFIVGPDMVTKMSCWSRIGMDVADGEPWS